MNQEKSMQVTVSDNEDDDSSMSAKKIRLSKNYEKVIMKTENVDDDEINAMALKIAEQNQMISLLKCKLKPTKKNKKITRKVQRLSNNGKFGWETLSNGIIPYIFRGDKKFCSVKMLQNKDLPDIHKYLKKDNLKCETYTISPEEAALLNEINFKHCDRCYGRDLFSFKDILISLKDAKEYYKYKK